jgi:DNA-binding winged helix-turn-helix (wHTH) protein
MPPRGGRLYRFDLGPGWSLDETLDRVTVNGVPLKEVYRQTVAILGIFFRAGKDKDGNDRLVPRDELSAAVWGREASTNDGLDRGVSRARKALRSHSDRLINVKGVGWRFESEPQGKPPLVRQDLAAAPAARFGLHAGMMVPGSREPFELVRPLGPPGSTVWLARKTSEGECRVYKFGLDLRRARNQLAQYQRLPEGLIARGVARLCDWNLTQPPYFVASASFGEDLLSFARRKDGLHLLGLPERVRLCAQIAGLVSGAHEVGVAHSGLRPGNVLVGPGPSGHEVRLTDFGCGLLIDAAPITSGGADPLIASRNSGMLYVPPEARMKPGAQATLKGDVYALSALAVHVLALNFYLSLDPGWEPFVRDAQLRRYICAGACSNPEWRASAADLAAWFACWPAKPKNPPRELDAAREPRGPITGAGGA